MPIRIGFSWTTLAFAVSGWVVSLFLGVLELPAKINSFIEVIEAGKKPSNFDKGK